MRKKEFEIPKNKEEWFQNKKFSSLSLYKYIIKMGGTVSSSYSDKDSIGQYFYDFICPFYVSLGLLEIKSVVGRKYYETRFTKDGIKFNQLLSKFEIVS